MKFDKTDLQIVRVLQEDARTPFATIAKRLGLSTSAVQARYEKMKNARLILGATVEVDDCRLGYCRTVMAIKTLSSNTKSVVAYLEGLKLGCDCSVFCCEAVISYYDVFLIIIHKDLLDLHLIKDMVTQHPAVLEVKANIITSFIKRDYSSLDLRHLIERRF